MRRQGLHDRQHIDVQIGPGVDEGLDFTGYGKFRRWIGLPACGVTKLGFEVKAWVARTRNHLTYIPSPSPLVHVTFIVTFNVTITVALFIRRS